MSRKYVKMIMNKIQTKIGLNERVIAIQQSSNKFIVETMNYIPSVPFSSIEIKDTFLLEELVGDSVLYQVETEISSTEENVSNLLRGPNYDIELVEENNNPTGFLNYDELFSYPVTNSY